MYTIGYYDQCIRAIAESRDKQRSVKLERNCNLMRQTDRRNRTDRLLLLEETSGLLLHQMRRIEEQRQKLSDRLIQMEERSIKRYQQLEYQQQQLYDSLAKMFS